MAGGGDASCFLFVNVKKKIMKKVWWKGKKFVPLHPLKSVLRWL